MAFKYLAALLLSTTALAQLRTTDFQQSLNANAPRNYVINSGAEKNDLNVTDAGGIVSRGTTAPLEGIGSFTIDAASSTQKAIFTASDLQSGLLGQSCEATFNYLGDATLYKAYVTLAGTTASTEVTLLNSGTSSQPVSIVFPCGASITDDPAVVVEATGNGASIKVDSVYLGKALSIGTVAQAQVIVSANRITSDQAIASGAATQVIFNGENKDSFSEYNATTGLFTSTRARDLLVTAGVYTNNVTSGQNTAVTVYKNGASANCASANRAGAASEGAVVASCLVSVVAGDTVAVYIDAGSDAAYDVIFDPLTYLTIESFPTTSQTILRGDSPGVGWTAFTPTGSWSTNTTYSGFYQCSNGNLSVRATAATSGAPTAATFTMNLPNSYTVDSTKISAATIYQTPVGAGQLWDNSASFAHSAQVLYGTTTSVSLVYQSALTGQQSLVTQAAPFTFAASDNVTISYTVPVTDSSPCAKMSQPFIPSSVFAGRSAVVKIGIASGTCSGTSAILNNPDTMLSAVGNQSGVTCSITLTTGFFSSTPTCVFGGLGAGGSARIIQGAVSSATAGSVYVRTTADVAGVSDFSLYCIGN